MDVCDVAKDNDITAHKQERNSSGEGAEVAESLEFLRSTKSIVSRLNR